MTSTSSATGALHAKPEIVEMPRGTVCDVCRRPFVGDPAATVAFWDRVAEAGAGASLAFVHKRCAIGVDSDFIFCGGGAWFSRRHQFASLRGLARRPLWHADAAALDQYRQFIRSWGVAAIRGALQPVAPGEDRQ